MCQKVYKEYKELDELNLAKCCLQHDKLAEEELYRRYAERVYSLCRRYLGDEDEAKDLMLEALFAALDRIDSFKYNGTGSLYGWIRRIAINKAVNLIKRHRWRIVHFDFWAQDNYNGPQISDSELSQKLTITLHRNGKDNTKKVHPGVQGQGCLGSS